MTRDVFRDPARQTGYRGDLDEAKPEKPGEPLRQDGGTEEENRGRRAPRTGSGAVIGSGAGAGGGGGAEDHDSDATGGGGGGRPHVDPRRGTGADAPKGGSR